MTAANHALTGALIGLTIGNPAALPLAFMSHFVLDAIPHHGAKADYIKSRGFAIQLLLDAVLCAVLVVILVSSGPANWLLAAACAFLAASPDFMWIPRFLRAKRGQIEQKPTNPIVRFHSWIQWFQRPVGALVEVVWFASTVFLLVKII